MKVRVDIPIRYKGERKEVGETIEIKEADIMVLKPFVTILQNEGIEKNEKTKKNEKKRTE